MAQFFYFNLLELLFIILFLIVTGSPHSIDALESRDNRLIAIEKEIADLQEQKNALFLEIRSDRREERNLEIKSQPNIVTYEWHAMADQLKKAESLEQEANQKEIAIKAIEQKIFELSNEKRILLQSES